MRGQERYEQDEGDGEEGRPGCTGVQPAPSLEAPRTATPRPCGGAPHACQVRDSLTCFVVRCWCAVARRGLVASVSSHAYRYVSADVVVAVVLVVVVGTGCPWGEGAEARSERGLPSPGGCLGVSPVVLVP